MRSENLIVFLKPKYLGDAVMATPLLKMLRSEYSNITMLAAPHIQEMLKEDAKGIRMLAPGPQKGPGAVFKEASRLRKERFHIAVLVNRSVRSALTAWFTKIPTRVGQNTEGRGVLLTRSVRYDSTKYEAAGYCELAPLLGISGEYPKVQLSVTDEERAVGRGLIGDATIGVQPGASFAAKTLPADRLGTVIDKLAELGHRPVMIGGREERSFGDELQRHTKTRIHNLIGECTLRESMGVVASLSACIGGSTGMMHIAAALGTPTVTIFGPTLSSRWGHSFEPHQSVQIASGRISDMDPDEVLQSTLRALGG